MIEAAAEGARLALPISGMTCSAAEAVAAEVGELQALGRRVAMVGDGVNDAPALAASDVTLVGGTWPGS